MFSNHPDLGDNDADTLKGLQLTWEKKYNRERRTDQKGFDADFFLHSNACDLF